MKVIDEFDRLGSGHILVVEQAAHIEVGDVIVHDSLVWVVSAIEYSFSLIGGRTTNALVVRKLKHNNGNLYY